MEGREQSCPHSKVSQAPRLRLGEILPVAELSARQLFIDSTQLRRCDHCRAVLVPTSLRRELSDLVEGLVALARSMKPSSELAVRLGRSTEPTEAEAAQAGGLTSRAARYRLTDVVLTEATRLEVEEALAKVRHHELIYEVWGFGAADPAGRGATINLHGPPGVGKSRTAEAIAGELGRPLLALTAGDLESRFMGETPRNVKAAFREAAATGSVLFFDEADSLFGKRASDVTQGIDHEVNVTKSVLLVEVERFEGVLVVATNFPQNFDRAFLRRLTYNVRMRLPDREARLRLWAMHVTGGIPLATDRAAMLDRLADESEGLSGGDILTAMRLALPAVVLERGDQGPLEFEHVQAAIERIRRARREVGRDTSGASSAAAMRRLLGPANEPSASADQTLPVNPPAPEAGAHSTDETTR